MITPTQILTLRASVRWKVSDAYGTVSDDAPPHITWSLSDQSFILHVHGHAYCASPDCALLGSCLTHERASPGWVRDQLCNPSINPTHVDPDAYAASQSRVRANAEAAKQREAATTREADAKRRASLWELSTFDLDRDL